MSEVKKIATRDSYGNALVELSTEIDELSGVGRRFGGGHQDTVFLKRQVPDRFL